MEHLLAILVTIIFNLPRLESPRLWLPLHVSVEKASWHGANGSWANQPPCEIDGA